MASDDLLSQRPLRIAFVDSWLQSAVDGSGTAVGIGGLEGALRRQGHRVDRIAPPMDGIRGRMPVTARRLLFNALLPARWDDRRYDLVVGFDIDGVWLPLRAAPYVCSVKGVIAEEARQETGRVRATLLALSLLEGHNTRRADRVVSTSRYCRTTIARHYHTAAERIGIVSEGIDVDEWQRAIAAAPPRSDTRPVLLCVSRQYRRKHIDDLLRAFALLRRRLPDACLRIVGDGPEHARLLALAHELGLGDSAAFLGGIPDDEVRREYAQADVFCMPSVQEGFGIVFLEAMAAGLPVVSTTAAAIPEVVRHGETGILVAPRDVAAMAGALLLLFSDRRRREQYGRAARELVWQYDWRRVCEMFLREVGFGPLR
jgi:glycosyltransferase involved in cell wall biosynthesis